MATKVTCTVTVTANAEGGAVVCDKCGYLAVAAAPAFIPDLFRKAQEHVRGGGDGAR